MEKRWASVHTLLFACLCLLGDASTAGPLQPGDVPDPLKPWIDWVQLDDKERLCPFFYNNFKHKRCAWPADLRLDLNDEEGAFGGGWRIFADSWITLPGDRTHWPRLVEVNGVAHAVVERRGRPSLHLGPGVYTLSGTFTWAELPESLAIPADTGIVTLALRGESIRFPDIDAQGHLWLSAADRGAADAAEQAANSQAITVLRRIVDDIPLQIYTRIEVDATGEPRELVIGRPLLEGFIPIGISSPLPARLEPSGDLRVQLRAGRHVIEIRARHPAPLAALTLQTQALPWPAEEVWAFDARHALRLVEIEGVAAIDPRQTRVPEDWHHLPVYTIAAGDAMRFVVIRRGDPEPEPDKLALSRRLWLDFDGRAYTVNDHIDGTITRNWRLDSGSDLHLGQVVIDAKPRFITRLGPGSPHGVEVRRGQVNLVADARMERHGDTFAATGWAHDFQRVEATLNLPPGWDVFAIDGVDNVPRTWLARWTLLDLFLVLVIAAAVMRLWGRRAGAVALLMLVLVWHAPEAPRYVWLSLVIAIALLRVLPAGRVRSMVGVFRGLTVLALMIICIPFAVNELRLAAYPQLASPHQRMGTPIRGQPAAAKAPLAVARGDSVVMMDSATSLEAEMMIAPTDEIAAARGLVASESVATQSKSASGVRLRSKRAKAFAIDPGAVIQTGPGLPQWHWTALQLNWNGPVAQTQTVSITYIRPPLNAIMHILRVAMIGVLLLLVFGVEGRRTFAAMRKSIAPVLVAGLALGGLPMPDALAGDFPDPALLETLRQRLSAPPECANRCADVTRMRLELDASNLQIRLETHAAEASAIPLPGQADQWLPQTVLIDGSAARALAREDGGALWLQLPPGVHQVYLSGALPGRRRVQLPLPLRPHATEMAVEAWSVEGLRDDGQVEAQLQLTRLGPDDELREPAAFAANQLPSFVRVERSLRLGLDWTVVTRVVRGAAGSTAAVLEVPLLAAESVVTPGIEVVDGIVRVHLAPTATSLTWESVLEQGAALTLSAPHTTAWLETWRLQVGPMWHVSFDGIAPIHHQDNRARWLSQWRPWPGETVTVKVLKPAGISGQTLTIDSTTIAVRPGKRATDSTLSMKLRSSKGGQYTMRLPAQVQLQAVRINGAAAALRAEGRDLTIPLTPGAQTVDVEWRRAEGIAIRFSSDAIDLAIGSINHQIEIGLGRDRWTLLTFGPSFGPAVLFWSLLAALLIVALGLARVPLTPLTTIQWLLLAIGLSQVAVTLAAIVVGWLFALGLRERYAAELAGYRFNLAQIGLVVLTVAALVVLIAAIRHGLLGHPDMHVAGNGSTPQLLRWYADQVASQPPSATVISVPILVYRLLMLAWALWLALAILRWLRWGWSCFGSAGLWRPWREQSEAPV